MSLILLPTEVLREWTVWRRCGWQNEDCEKYIYEWHKTDRQIDHFMPVMFWFCKYYRNTTKTQLQKFHAGMVTRPKVSFWDLPSFHVMLLSYLTQNPQMFPLRSTNERRRCTCGNLSTSLTCWKKKYIHQYTYEYLQLISYYRIGPFSWYGKDETFITINVCIENCPIASSGTVTPSKVKLSRYTPWRRLGGEEV
jgi:hypothetical protein